MRFVITKSLPVVAIVYKEVGDFTEDFERNSVVERHGGGDDDGMMSSENGGGDVVWRIFAFAMVFLCVGSLWDIVWQLVSVFLFFPFLVCKIEDRCGHFFSCAR